MSTIRKPLAAALREAADLLEQHPELPQPYVTTSANGSAKLAWYLPIDHGGDLATQKDAARTIVSTLGGQWMKAASAYSEDFNFTQARGLLSFTVQVERPAVCERIVVGTETRTIPAVEAQPERTETVEKVEWRCQPLLADDAVTETAVA